MGNYKENDMRDKEIIATFGCQKNIFVYPVNCPVLPMSPYRPHDTVDKAIEHLKSKGILEPKILIQS